MQSFALTTQEIEQISGGAVPTTPPASGPGPYNPFPDPFESAIQ